MNWIFEFLGDTLRTDTISSTAADLMIHLALKSTVVLLIALLVTKVAINKSAAARHLVWMLSFVAIAVTLLLPGIWPTQPVYVGSLVAGNEVFDPTAFDESGQLPDFMVQRFQQSETEASIAPVLDGLGQIADSTAGNTNETQGQIDSRNRTPATFAWGQQIQSLAVILLATWIVGTTVFLSLLVIGHLAMQRRQLGFHRATNRRLLAVVKRTRHELGIKRDVTLYQSDDEAIPMTWGVFSPSVWLPTSAQDWSDDRLRMVLLHELAHVRRFDCLWQAIALVSLAVHWFNPLVWLAAMRMRSECEKACDDVVLSSGVPRANYAAELLDISTFGRRGVLAMCAGLAMTRSHKLTNRVEAIVDTNRNRSRVSGATLTTSMIVTVVVILMVTLSTNVTLEARAGGTATPVQDLVKEAPAALQQSGQSPEEASSQQSKAEPSPADSTTKAEPPWGQVVEGVSIRIRPEGWSAELSSSPELQVDVRNQSEKEVLFVRRAESCSLEIDGRWYWQRRTTERGVGLGSGETQARVIEFSIDDAERWIDKQAGTPLQLTEGRHKLRVALACDQGFPSKEPVSNTVEFVVLPESSVEVTEAERMPSSRIYSVLPFADGANLSLVADEKTMPGRNFLGAPVASHDGNWIVVDATKGRAFSQTHLIKIAIAGHDKGKVVDLGFGVGPTFSPDDKQIAFFLNNKVPSGEERGVWVMNADGTNRRRITNGLHPQWCPDGKSLLCVTRFLSPRQLTLVDIESGKRTRLLKNEEVVGQPAWSPDGKQIAVTVKDEDDRVLCLFKPEPEPETRTELWRSKWDEEYDETWPDWSLDGKSILFTFWKVEDDTVNAFAMSVAAKPGSKATKLGFVPAGADIRDCCWSADSKRVLFASSDDVFLKRATKPSE